MYGVKNIRFADFAVWFFGCFRQEEQRPAKNTAEVVHQQKQKAWYEIENIDGRNQAEPMYMLPLYVSDEENTAKVARLYGQKKWYEIGNIDGRNQAEPMYMLPLNISDRG